MSFASSTSPPYQQLKSPDSSASSLMSSLEEEPTLKHRTRRNLCANFSLKVIGQVIGSGVNAAVQILATGIPTVVMNVGGALKTALHITGASTPTELTHIQKVTTYGLASPFSLMQPRHFFNSYSFSSVYFYGSGS